MGRFVFLWRRLLDFADAEDDVGLCTRTRGRAGAHRQLAPLVLPLAFPLALVDADHRLDDNSLLAIGPGVLAASNLLALLGDCDERLVDKL